MYLLKSKDEVIKKFVLYKNEVRINLSKKIKVLRSDRDGVYESLFVDVCAQHGMYMKSQHFIHLNPMEWLSERIIP